jgi:PilZ domain
MDAINTRRWPRFHVYLPVLIAANADSENVTVPGLVCELSRAGMELYGGVNLQPGDLMEVEFQTPDRIRVAGVVRSRSGFCFGLEFCTVKKEREAAAEALESFIRKRHETYVQEKHEKINQSLQMVQELRKCRQDIELLAQALDEWLQTDAETRGKRNSD